MVSSSSFFNLSINPLNELFSNLLFSSSLNRQLLVANIDAIPLLVDDGAFAERGAEAQIAFRQWRQAVEYRLRVNLAFRHDIHGDILCRQRSRP